MTISHAGVQLESKLVSDGTKMEKSNSKYISKINSPLIKSSIFAIHITYLNKCMLWKLLYRVRNYCYGGLLFSESTMWSETYFRQDLFPAY